MLKLENKFFGPNKFTKEHLRGIQLLASKMPGVKHTMIVPTPSRNGAMKLNIYFENPVTQVEVRKVSSAIQSSIDFMNDDTGFYVKAKFFQGNQTSLTQLGNNVIQLEFTPN